MVRFPAPSRRSAGIALCTGAALLLAGCGNLGNPFRTDEVRLSGELSGRNEMPAVASPGSGQAEAWFNRSTNTLRWNIAYSGLTGPATAGHFHGPAILGQNAGVALPFKAPLASPIRGEAVLTPAQAEDLLQGKWYANIHTAAHPGGEIRGQMLVRN